MGLRFNVRLIVGAGLALAGPIAACSSGPGKGGFPSSGSGVDPNGDHPSSTGDDASTGAPGVSGSSSGSGSGQNGMFTHTYSDAGNTAAPSSADAACAFSAQMGKQQGLDAYMMLDYSASMRESGKWTGVTSAINSFVMQPTSGISVGLQYFGLPDPDAGTGVFGIPVLGDSCDPAIYAKPEIEISPLPAVGAQITASLAMHTMPNTSTPTPAALKGAIQHATVWEKAHPADATIVILATDGDPTECGTMQNESQAQYLADTEAVAAAGVAGTPKILTFVIGVGTDTSNLNGIAMAGGTTSAFIVDTTMNISTQFLAALNKIRGAALGCQYKVPVPMVGTTNFNEVNVQFTASGGKPTIFPQCADKAHCPASGNAWYYDNPAAPANIILCTTSCGTVATGGEVDVLTGCQTVMAPPEK